MWHRFSIDLSHFLSIQFNRQIYQGQSMVEAKVYNQTSLSCTQNAICFLAFSIITSNWKKCCMLNKVPQIKACYFKCRSNLKKTGGPSFSLYNKASCIEYSWAALKTSIMIMLFSHIFNQNYNIILSENGHGKCLSLSDTCTWRRMDWHWKDLD